MRIIKYLPLQYPYIFFYPKSNFHSKIKIKTLVKKSLLEPILKATKQLFHVFPENFFFQISKKYFTIFS